MICPVCKKATIAIEYRQIELDYCTMCKGVWFDNVELELLLHTLELGHENIISTQILKMGEARNKGKKHSHVRCQLYHDGRKEMSGRTSGRHGIGEHYGERHCLQERKD